MNTEKRCAVVSGFEKGEEFLVSGEFALHVLMATVISPVEIASNYTLSGH
jgi:hypothetical protein